MLPSLSKISLAKAALFKNTPIYVQYYITARCNLTCQQCNVIYANSDTRECTLDEVKGIADNLAKLGVAVVLLTGGEPFIRKDLPEMIREFQSRDIHVRIQTNGFATKEMIHKAIEFGGHDISISLDSLIQTRQDRINGGFEKSWNKALDAIAHFTQYLPKENSFGALGCVLQRENLEEIEDVIRFGTEISWFTSLVPIHTTTHSKPRSFRTFDRKLEFRPEEYDAVDTTVERIRAMKSEGYLLYDSDQYLDDIKRFVRKEPTTWRSKNNGLCDSPNLYFAVLPNGQFAPCCDLRMPNATYVYGSEFTEHFWEARFRKSVHAVTGACEGCMYGSYPEMTISMRYLAAKWERFKLFLAKPPKKNWPISNENIYEIAHRIHARENLKHG